ncbi:MAG: hypothetical protein JWQ90_815 [Hydrocarboniphaga sp.]|uniref:spirocyclase AveC family protein n=1 Tax=Hydrocarboniphaga sp. TaxID=2033016 RepID=UPI0026300976|nr:spirocyclase AveC family protein [Hydrocarboniphaga sp.]MDB5968365.1 hypothetical protein [Hydrocarboniphaga sp.]
MRIATSSTSVETGTVISAARTRALDVPAHRASPVAIWAALGGLIFCFQAYVLLKWMTGPYFVPTPTGPDKLSQAQSVYFLFLQIAVPLGALYCLMKWVALPRIRLGHLTADGRLFLAGTLIFFWDMSMNYSSTSLLYNSHMLNFGAWTLGSWPMWFSPAANLLPEPVLVTIPGYTALVTTQALFVCWLLRKAKVRWPRLGILASVALIIVGCTVVDSTIELLLIRTGVYAYPGAIRSFAIFPGQTYQFPLNEGILFGGLGVGSMTALLFFRDDKGQTFVERGIESLKYGPVAKGWLRGFAVFGYCHLMFIILYAIPMQFFSLHAGAFPEGYPSYMLNGMCVYGVTGDQCPGPGVMIPRIDTPQ